MRLALHVPTFSPPRAPSEYVAPLLKNPQWLPGAFWGQPSLPELHSGPYPRLTRRPVALAASSLLGTVVSVREAPGCSDLPSAPLQSCFPPARTSPAFKA